MHATPMCIEKGCAHYFCMFYLMIEVIGWDKSSPPSLPVVARALSWSRQPMAGSMSWSNKTKNNIYAFCFWIVLCNDVEWYSWPLLRFFAYLPTLSQTPICPRDIKFNWCGLRKHSLGPILIVYVNYKLWDVAHSDSSDPTAILNTMK